MEACNALATASHASTAHSSCILLGWLLRFFTKFFVIHVLVLHSFLSPRAKRDLFPGNIVDIRGNDTRGTDVLFCSRDETRPLDARRSTAHLSVPTHFITDVDSMPPCLDFYPITGSFSVFTPCMECSFVQGLWRPNPFSTTDYFLFVRLCTLQHGIKAYMIVWILLHSADTHTF